MRIVKKTNNVSRLQFINKYELFFSNIFIYLFYKYLKSNYMNTKLLS